MCTGSGLIPAHGCPACIQERTCSGRAWMQGALMRRVRAAGVETRSWVPGVDDDPFIVLTETKFSIRYIPVWARRVLASPDKGQST
jgi:hypothetical protein